jgi:3-(3-hydroxy-phenyl)propionate hydroxylase
MPGQFEASSRLGQDTEVAIVGAGPVGLMIANLLGIAGVRVTVLERHRSLLGLPRAIAYDAATLRLFAQVGLFEQIAPGLIQNPPVRHLSARQVRLMAMDVPVRGLFGHSALGTFYQPDLEKALLQGLSRLASVRVLLEHVVTGLDQNADGVELNISTPQGERQLCANFVIGCDGGTSAVRGMVGARLVGSTYTERWLVIDALVKNHDVRQITFHCDPRRPRVELPAVGERVRWEFMQLPGEQEEILKSDDTIRALVMQHTKYRAFEVERKAVYTFHARVADHWRRGRVFLAGDAAHMMPPFAGQGMNGGMRDAVNLSWKLVAVLRGQATDAILDTYEVERAPAVRKMVEVSRRLGSVIMPTTRIAAAARDSIFACLNLSSRFRDFIGAGKIVPPPCVRQSTLTAAGRDRLIGQMMPQPAVSPTQGSALLDQHLTCHQWMALGIGVDPAAMLSNRDRAILDALDARFICLNGATVDTQTLSLQCADQDFLRWVEQYKLRTVLVRPDRFIAARLDPGNDLVPLTPFASAQPTAASRIAA